MSEPDPVAALSHEWPAVIDIARELALILNASHRVTRNLGADFEVHPQKLADFLRVAIKAQCEERLAVERSRAFATGAAWAEVKYPAERLQEIADGYVRGYTWAMENWPATLTEARKAANDYADKIVSAPYRQADSTQEPNHE